MINIARLYEKKSFVLAEMDSRKDFGDSETDYLIKRLIVSADEVCDGWCLVAYIRTETFDIDSNVVDQGFFDGGGSEVYRMLISRNSALL